MIRDFVVYLAVCWAIGWAAGAWIESLPLSLAIAAMTIGWFIAVAIWWKVTAMRKVVK